MPEPEVLEASDLYSERLIRSVAHNIGNAVNVLSGRLSLLEMEEGMRPESLEMLALMKDRLRRTQGELRGAVRFISETLREANGDVNKEPELVLSAIDACASVLGEVAGKEEAFANDNAQRCRANGDLRCSLQALAKGVRAVAGASDQPRWSLDAKPEGVALEVVLPASLLPNDRRSVMEPWFESAAINLTPTERKGRLEIAVALSRLEDAGANVAVFPANESDKAESRLQVLWIYP